MAKKQSVDVMPMVKEDRRERQHPALPAQADFAEVKIEDVQCSEYKYTRDGKEVGYLKTFSGRLPEHLVKVMIEKCDSFYAVHNPFFAKITHTDDSKYRTASYGLFAEMVPQSEQVLSQVQYLLEGLYEGYVLALPKGKPYYFTYKKQMGKVHEGMDPKYMKYKEFTEWFETHEQAEDRLKDMHLAQRHSINQDFGDLFLFFNFSQNGDRWDTYLDRVSYDERRAHPFY